jgi:hypothetical protein
VPDEPSSWTDLINKSVHTSDDQDIGDIEAVSRNFIVIKKGLVNVHRYYIPLHRVEGWDGKVVWLKIAEDAVKANYEREMQLQTLTSITTAVPLQLTHQTSCADFRSICPKSLREAKKKNHFLFLKNPQGMRSAPSSVIFAI